MTILGLLKLLQDAREASTLSRDPDFEGHDVHLWQLGQVMEEVVNESPDVRDILDNVLLNVRRGTDDSDKES